MAELPTADDNLEIVLGIFRDKGTRPGEVLPMGVFQEYLRRNLETMRAADLNVGIQLGCDQGYFERTGLGFLRLTQPGYEKI
jgi:hypothetical protein